MGEFLSELPAITHTGGFLGVFLIVVLAVLGLALKRIDKAPAEIQAGYSALVGDLQKSKAVEQEGRLQAEREVRRKTRAVGRERSLRVKVQDYARGLEIRFELPHREWEEPEDDEGEDS